MTLKELRHRRGEIEHQMRALLDGAEKENRDLTSEEDVKFKALHDEDCGLRSRIERAEKVERVASENAEPRAGVHRRSEFPPASAVGDEPDDDDPRSRRDGASGTAENRTLAFASWAGMPLSRRMREACRDLRFNPRASEIVLRMHGTREFRQLQREFLRRHHTQIDTAEMRAGLTTGSGSAGGAVIGQEFVREMEIALLANGPMLAVSDVRVTPTGAEMKWPTADDTSNMGRLVGEAAEISDDNQPSFSAGTLAARKFTSDFLKFSSELEEDSEFGLEAMLGEMAGTRIGRRANLSFTVGEGPSASPVPEPLGIVTAAPIGVTAAADNALASDELFDLQHSVPEPYQADPSCAWMMHNQVLLVIRKMKHEGQYLFQPGLQDGVPDRLLGRPIRVNDDMWSSISIGKVVVLYGAMAKYKIRIVRGVRAERIRERFADTDERAVVSYLRADGTLLDAGSGPVKALQMNSASG